jgi:dGTPase
MKGHGGFEHNQHSLRIVEELEQKYPDFPGLNLSWEVREGLAKHHTAYDHPDQRERFQEKSPSLEAQIANLSDEITYYSHDLDDGLDSGLLSENELADNVRVWKHAAKLVKNEYGNLPDESLNYFMIRTIIDMQIHDVVENSERLIRETGVNSADDVRRFPKALIQYGAARRKLNLELRNYLYKNLYFNSIVQKPNLRAVKMLGELFKYYLKNPKEIGESSQKRIKSAGLHRAVCDYIAGMTDRYVMLEFQRIFGETFERNFKRHPKIL